MKLIEARIHGSAIAGSSVSVFAAGELIGVTKADDKGAFELNHALPPGAHNLRMEAKSPGGKIESASTTLELNEVDATDDGEDWDEVDRNLARYETLVSAAAREWPVPGDCSWAENIVTAGGRTLPEFFDDVHARFLLLQGID